MYVCKYIIRCRKHCPDFNADFWLFRSFVYFDPLDLSILCIFRSFVFLSLVFLSFVYFYPLSFDPLIFDPLSFDPLSFDPLSFYGLR
jgi:hypothetical protein